MHIAVIAIDSLSYPPPTERMRCAGTTAMMAAESPPTAFEPVHSLARRPRKTVAETPNHAGTNTHTSFSDIWNFLSNEPSTCQIHTEVICMPG